MGALTEREIFDCLTTNFKLAAEHAEDLARLPIKGPTYELFRRELRLIEGACRQASAWREDTRWLPIGRMMAEVHQKAGGWLRGYKHEGIRIALAPSQQQPLFLMLAANLRALLVAAEQTRTARTGRIGMILPDMLPAPHRDTRPVGWMHASGQFRIRSVPRNGIIAPTAMQ